MKLTHTLGRLGLGSHIPVGRGLLISIKVLALRNERWSRLFTTGSSVSTTEPNSLPIVSAVYDDMTMLNQEGIRDSRYDRLIWLRVCNVCNSIGIKLVKTQVVMYLLQLL
ncbi:hypothetical protein PIB30_062038 [Stylosanthes scabra]|uniref:Uncharacterized protein n=1 Tax=Stylosanthes scabra TaxID=79078 RepID=A0ABU6YJW2_9FABA|nr:hypothetical protein [Stylosanthes scabra]